LVEKGMSEYPKADEAVEKKFADTGTTPANFRKGFNHANADYDPMKDKRISKDILHFGM
jgi:hypothetical protein